MRLLFTLLSLFACSVVFSQQQGVAINADGSTPDASAMLDIKSTSRGLLAPRMTYTQRIAIASPATGLIVYQTNDNLKIEKGIYVYDGTAWRRLTDLSDLTSSNSWTKAGDNQYSSVDGNVGIGTNSPDSKLDVNGTVRISGGTQRLNFITDQAGPDGDFLVFRKSPGIQFIRPDNTVLGRMEYVDTLDYANFLRFHTGSSQSNDLTITSAHEVGIGTNNPQAKLQVSGGTGEQLRIHAASDPIIQFTEGFLANQTKKGFIQLSGDNLRIGTNSGNDNGSFVVRTNGTDRLTIDGGGAAFFTGSVNATSANISGTTNISGNAALRNGGILSIAKSGGLKTVEIKPTENGSDGASMLLYNSAGVVTIEMDADHGGDGDGRVITNELQINGGSDLAENFDVNIAEEKNLKPGMLVSIDSEQEGLLCITKQANDKKIVGVISGANGIKPGMLMGQQGTIAYGKYPVALAGRVYVFCNDEGGEINAGDFLTSSSKRGYAKKAGNLNDAQGAIIGKAMGKADTKTGFVLVLINLQ